MPDITPEFGVFLLVLFFFAGLMIGFICGRLPETGGKDG